MLTTVLEAMNPVTEFGVQLLAWIEIVIEATVDGFEGVVDIFWNSSDGFSLYGVLMIFGLAVGFVGLAIGFMYRLLQK